MIKSKNVLKADCSRRNRMKKTYALTAAQNMHYQWIKEYKTQQVSGLSIVAAFQADIDVDTLKQSIELEKQRYSCLRLRFTKPDMPIRFFSGADDPCAISKEKLGEAMAVLKKAGYRDVKCRRYAGMRHDILHEREKHLVYRDILEFIEA
jgi:alpha-beta hydrolase superfamily lysophospholipase